MFKNLDPGLLTMTWNGIDMAGPMNGTYLSVERAEDAFKMHTGADGDVTRVRNRNRTGSASITLIQASPANSLLSAMALQDEQDGGGVGALLIKDLAGTTQYSAAQAWIRKVPKGEHSDDALGREWIIDCAYLKMNVGGSLI